MELKRISAKEARERAEKVDGTLKRIYKFIGEEAQENSTSLFYNFKDPAESAVEAVIADLKNNGYKVEKKDTEDCVELLITW